MGNYVGRWWVGVCLLFLQFLSTTSFGGIPSLAERVAVEFDQPGTGFSATLTSDLAQKHVVFIDGIMNELARLAGNYFTDNMNQLDTLNISYDHLRYSSGTSIPENAERLFEDIQRIVREMDTNAPYQRKPIILVGHSMGGAEALYVLLKHPELLLSNIVEKAVLIEASIGGSVMADSLNCAGKLLFKRSLGGGLKSLSPPVAQKNFVDVFDAFQNTLSQTFGEKEKDRVFQELSKRVFYVRSALHPDDRLSFGLNIVMFFFKGRSMGDVDNDGLMAVDNQILGLTPLFGVDLGILEADHIELVISGISSHSSKKFRKAFTRAFLQSIYDDPNELMKLTPPRTLWKVEEKPKLTKLPELDPSDSYSQPCVTSNL